MARYDKAPPVPPGAERSRYMREIPFERLTVVKISDQGTFDDGVHYVIVQIINHTRGDEPQKLLINKQIPRLQILEWFADHPGEPIEGVAFLKHKPPELRLARWEMMDADRAADLQEEQARQLRLMR